MKRIAKKMAALLLAALVAVPAFAAPAQGMADGPPGEEFLPVREFFESLGAAVEWAGHPETVLVTFPDFGVDLLLTLVVGAGHADINGSEIPLAHGVIRDGYVTYIHIADLEAISGPIDSALLELMLAELPGEDGGHLPMTVSTAASVGDWVLGELGIAGMVVSIVDANNGFAWSRGFGVAGGGAPVTGDTVFGAGSISKTFTAIRVMQLVEAGVIGLDDTLAGLLPGFSALTDELTGTADYRNVTVRMLLSHASGLFPDISPSGLVTADGHEGGFMNGFVETFSRLPSVAPEASVFSYANSGYVLLGVLLAELAGYDDAFLGYESLMQENVLGPLGMASSSFILDGARPNLAGNFLSAGLEDELLFYNFLPTGSLNTTANDMNRFMAAVLLGGELDGNRILEYDTLSQMLTPQDFDFEDSPAMFGNLRFGLGFNMASELDGFAHWGHGGTLVHHHAAFALDMNNGLGVFVAANSVAGMYVTPEAFASLLLRTAIEESGGLLVLPSPDLGVEMVEMSREELLGFEGLFVGMGISENLWKIEAGDGALLLHAPIGEEPMEFVPLSDGSFAFAGDFAFRIWLDDSYSETLIFAGEFKNTLMAAALPAEYLAVPDGFEQWLGVYEPVLDEPHHRSLVTSLEVGMDGELGFAYMRMATLHGLAPFSPLIYLGDGRFAAYEFEMEDGAAYLRSAGAVFRRN